MKRIAAFLVLMCSFSVGSHAQATSAELMTNAEYKAVLLQVEAALPKWETALKSINPEKDERISYSLGKSIVDKRDLGVMEVPNIRVFIAKEQIKHTVYGELALYQFLEGLYNMMSDVVEQEVIAGVTLSSLEENGPELSALERRVGNDAMARVSQLEKGTCP
jgi:hypothetical protein